MKKNNLAVKIIMYILSVLMSLSLIIIAVITVMEILLYGCKDFYQNEYEKYDVKYDVNMEMDDLVLLSDEMMQYLRGDRQDLNIVTTIGGEKMEFFNEKEKTHMADVRALFIGALHLRIILLVTFIVLLGVLLLLNYHRALFLFFKTNIITTTAFILLTSITAGIVSTNFTKYFDVFHHIFFSNQLWIMNEDEDRIINILPEGFFVDLATRIGIVTVIVLLFNILISSLYLVIYMKVKVRQNNIKIMDEKCN